MISDFIVNTSTIFGVAFGGTLLSLIGCSQIYKLMKKQFKEEEFDYKHKTLRGYYKNFENRYTLCDASNNDTKDNVEKDETEDDDLYENRYVHEFTPSGGLIMKYNSNDKLFMYWADQNIKHCYLITVARKFCKLYRCEHLYYLDTNDLYEEQDKEDKDKIANEEDTSDTENEFLFLKKKELETSDETGVFNEKHIKTSIRFRKAGPIREFDILKKSRITESLKYRDFKIM